MIKIGIVEDEPVIAELIRVSLIVSGYLALDPVSNYQEALEMIINDKPDLVILDIHLSGSEDGIILARKINTDYQLPFIFLTAFSDRETIAKAKLVSPGAFLIKPFRKEELFATIEICLDNFNKKREESIVTESGINTQKPQATEHIFVKVGVTFQKIFLSDIVYLKSEHVYVTIMTKTHRYLVRTSMRNFMTKLDKTTFLKIHKSYAININFIQNVESQAVKILDVKLPLGKNYRDEFLSKIGLT